MAWAELFVEGGDRGGEGEAGRERERERKRECEREEIYRQREGGKTDRKEGKLHLLEPPELGVSIVLVRRG
jgi:hypothetical protein